MSHMPQEPEAFAEQVATLLKRTHPELKIVMNSPGELIVDGRRLDLENLYRLVSTDPPRGTEIVESYLDHLFDEETFSVQAMPWELARHKIMPRIQPLSIFQHLSRELVAHVPYVNDTVVVFVIDMPSMTVSVTTEQMIRWGLSPEDLDELARNNLAEYAPELDFKMMSGGEGGKAVILAEHDGYDASRLLLDRLFVALAPRLGGDFLVATPSRDMFLAMTPGPDEFINRVRSRVCEDFSRLPYPITPRLFYVTRDGVAGTESQAA